MDLVLCHTTADFDTLGAAVGITRLQTGARIVLAGGCHPGVQLFLAFHRDEYALVERRAVNPQHIRALTIVDTQQRSRLGVLAEWIAIASAQSASITLYDHHIHATADITATQTYIEPVGAATTLVVEHLRQKQITLTIAEATVMALGIHVDTGSLTFDQATPRDAQALAWLMEQGASQRTIADFIEPGLSPTLQDLLTQALDLLTTESIRGYTLSWVFLDTEHYVPGLSSLAGRLMSLTDSDVLVLAARYPVKGDGDKLILIGRANARVSISASTGGVDFQAIFKPWGGGGHPTAASAILRTEAPSQVLTQVLVDLRLQIPSAPTARELMSSPVRTIRPATLIAEAQRILLRYGHSGLSVVNAEDELVGIISRRDIDLALHHGFSHAPVKGYMTTNVKTITPDTTLPEIEALMVTYDIGRLPVLEQGQLVGVVTRTDVLRQLHQTQQVQIQTDESLDPALESRPPSPGLLQKRLQEALKPELIALLQMMSEAAQQRGWHLYLVGGAVRDLLLTHPSKTLVLQDIDLVVDGFYQTAQSGAGVELATAVRSHYPQAELQTYGRFQTAALIWHHDSEFGSLMIDIATARTEFYPYPAANPEVEASSIQQDLYRRDFTINAMAIRLTHPAPGTLLDFFGGVMDLRTRQIRVLHSNSFIEDPTRIYRAVRFAVRLGFQIDTQTESFIHTAIDSGIYIQMQQQVAKVPGLQTRLKNEFKYILESPYWQPSLSLLDKLGALQCLHPQLTMSDTLWHQMRRLDRWIQRFQLQDRVVPWQLLLEVLIAQIDPPTRDRTAENLQLPTDSIQRLNTLDHLEASLQSALAAAQTASQIYTLLQPIPLPTLLLLSARQPRAIGQRAWRYFTTLSTIKPLLDGHDLKALGYKPGSQYREMLTALTAATLDRVITSVEEAKHFLATHYPLG